MVSRAEEAAADWVVVVETEEVIMEAVEQKEGMEGVEMVADLEVCSEVVCVAAQLEADQVAAEVALEDRVELQVAAFLAAMKVVVPYVADLVDLMKARKGAEEYSQRSTTTALLVEQLTVQPTTHVRMA